MPFIHAKTNLPVTSAQADSIKTEFGKAIALIPGKTERWLMVGIDEKQMLWMGGTDAPTAMVYVSLLGDAPAGALEALTAKITEILGNALEIAPDRVYVEYQTTPSWGWNGGNF